MLKEKRIVDYHLKLNQKENQSSQIRCILRPETIKSIEVNKMDTILELHFKDAFGDNSPNSSLPYSAHI